MIWKSCLNVADLIQLSKGGFVMKTMLIEVNGETVEIPAFIDEITIEEEPLNKQKDIPMQISYPTEEQTELASRYLESMMEFEKEVLQDKPKIFKKTKNKFDL